jgi:flagellin
MSSILTNSSALVALQTLKSTNVGLAKAQNEISTGLKVATAKDNSSSWSIASTMKSDVKSFAKLSETVVTAGATVGTARAAAEQVADILKDIQAKFVQAEDYAAGSPELTAIQDEVTALTETIVSIATAAQVNGVNLTATGATALDVTVSVVRDATGAVNAEAVTVAAQDLEALGAALTVGTDTLDAVDTLLDTANAAAAAFGAAQARIEAQGEFLSKQADALKSAVGAMVDADMEEASARLSALQVQQQLGIQALSIANQAPQSILSLFR